MKNKFIFSVLAAIVAFFVSCSPEPAFSGSGPVGYISKVGIKGLTYTVGGAASKVPTTISNQTVEVEKPLVVELDSKDYKVTVNFKGDVTTKYTE